MVQALTALDSTDTRHEDLLVANPNHEDQYNEEETNSGSDQNEKTTEGDGTYQ